MMASETIDGRNPRLIKAIRSRLEQLCETQVALRGGARQSGKVTAQQAIQTALALTAIVELHHRVVSGNGTSWLTCPRCGTDSACETLRQAAVGVGIRVT